MLAWHHLSRPVEDIILNAIRPLDPRLHDGNLNGPEGRRYDVSFPSYQGDSGKGRVRRRLTRPMAIE